MRRMALLVSIISLFILMLFINYGLREIYGVEELEDLELNQRVTLNGVVHNEKGYDHYSIIQIKNVTLTCECSNSYLGKNVSVLGIISEYEGKKQIKILRINIEN